MIEYDNNSFEDWIEKDLLDRYFRNIEEINSLKEKEKILLKELERKDIMDKKQMKKLEKEKKNIELMIQNSMQLMDTDSVIIDDNDISIKKVYKVAAKPNKKDSLINYIKDNNLPISTWEEKAYNKEELINYLKSNDYIESYHNMTSEIESYIKLKEDISISIKKIKKL